TAASWASSRGASSSAVWRRTKSLPTKGSRPFPPRRRRSGTLRRSGRDGLSASLRGESAAVALLSFLRASARCSAGSGGGGAQGRVRPLHRPRWLTWRSDRADPEDVRGTLRPYHERVKSDGHRTVRRNRREVHRRRRDGRLRRPGGARGRRREGGSVGARTGTLRPREGTARGAGDV